MVEPRHRPSTQRFRPNSGRARRVVHEAAGRGPRTQHQPRDTRACRASGNVDSGKNKQHLLIRRQVVLSILHARELGLRLSIIYNTSSFDSLESIQLLDGLVDIYLPDFKVCSDKTSKRLLKADKYAQTAMESIKAMHAQVGDLCFTADGIAKKGVMVRHLVMPGMEDEGKEIMKWLAHNVSSDLMVHVMEQYFHALMWGKSDVVVVVLVKTSESRVRFTPHLQLKREVRYADINRPVDLDEAALVKKAAQEAGLWRSVEAARHGGFTI
jgi:putative pyruvate formate lyase activating enzyme